MTTRQIDRTYGIKVSSLDIAIEFYTLQYQLYCNDTKTFGFAALAPPKSAEFLAAAPAISTPTAGA